MRFRASLSFNHLLASSLVAAAAVIGFVAWTLYATTRDAAASAAEVNHSEEVLRFVGLFREGFATISAGQRGYLLYGAPGFLQERDQAIERARSALARLQELTVDDPVQLQRAKELSALLVQRAEAARAEAAGVARAGPPLRVPEEVHARTAEAKGRSLALTAALEEEENRLLADRKQIDASRQRRSAIVITASFVAFTGMMLLAYAGMLFESRRLASAQRQMTEIVEGLPVTVWQMVTRVDGARRFVYVGRDSHELLGLSARALVEGKESPLASLAPDDAERVEQAMRHSEQTLAPLDSSYRLAAHVTGGEERWVHEHAQVRQLADGSLLWTGYWSDITARKQMEKALRETTEAANLANRAKSAFLATMSHEIRTPMTGVTGLLELLSLTPLDGEQRATMAVIRESARSLLRIIDDILDFSRIEEGRLALAPVPASLREAVQRACNLHSGVASSRGLLLEHAFDPRLGAAHVFDPLRLGQILNNLISNAVKFTEEGGVQVAVELLERSGGNERIRVVVTDTGIGVPPQTMALLFQPFTQGGPQITSTYGGSGLGLAICRRLAHLMGGSVAMESSPGHGSRMLLEVSFPVADPAAVVNTPEAVERQLTETVAGRRAAPTTEQAEAEGTLVLVVDDHPTNRLVLCRQVATLGYGVLMAQDGVEALALWRSRRIGLVLTDSNMPNMNGYELARAIRRQEALEARPRVPIIACTANAMGSETARSTAAGMDAYLIKPVDLLDLLASLQQWLPLPAGDPGGRPTLPPSGAAAEILPFDPAVLRMISYGDPAIEHQVITDFLRANAGDLHGLREAAAVGDLPEVGRLAHRVTGAAQTLGARGLLQACREVEARVRAGDVEGTRAALAGMAAESAVLEQAFRARLRMVEA